MVAKPVLREVNGRMVDIRPSCLDKARQPDEATARAIAMHMLEAGLVKSRRAWVYACRFCRGWHVTTTFRPGNGAAVSATNPWIAEDGRA